jgi:hypothetical protein
MKNQYFLLTFIFKESTVALKIVQAEDSGHSCKAHIPVNCETYLDSAA